MKHRDFAIFKIPAAHTHTRKDESENFISQESFAEASEW